MSMMYHLREITNDIFEKLNADPESIEDVLDEDGDNELDLDKAWHGVHYLLTGNEDEGEEPFCYLMTGGKRVGDIDVGYGPATVLSKEQVKSFSDALSTLSTEQLKARFDPETMSDLGIYPDIWVEEGDEALDWLLEVIDADLNPFLSTVSKNGNAVLLWID